VNRVDADRFVILLVDDDEVDVLMFRRALAQAKLAYPLAVAREGQQALDYLAGAGKFADRSKHPLPSYVLLDLKLPKVSGLEVLSWMKRSEAVKDIPVAILSGSAEGNDIERSKGLGIDEYLVKPAGFPDLQALIERLGRRWEALRNALKE
jgi:CheY-like chemotaxis protein